jgi:hypothetical protein
MANVIIEAKFRTAIRELTTIKPTDQAIFLPVVTLNSYSNSH